MRRLISRSKWAWLAVFAVVLVLAGVDVHATTTGTSVISNQVRTTWVTHTSGAISLSLAEGVPVEILEVRLALDSAGGAGSFTITINDADGTLLDTVLVTQDMTSATDVHWLPVRPVALASGDSLDCAYANSNNKDYGCKILYRRQ